MTDIDIAILIKTAGQHRTAIFLEILFHIRSAAEKGHTKGGFCNNQNIFLLIIKLLQNEISQLFHTKLVLS